MQTALEIGLRGMQKWGVKPSPEPPIPDAIHWIQSNFYLYDTGQLMQLYDCQRLPLELALSRDAVGNYRFNTVLWSWPKKSAKSSVIAAVADYVASHRRNASVKLVANDLKQADSRIGYYLRESILLSQKAGKRPGIKVTPSGYTVTYPNRAKIECVPIDPSGEAGGNDDLIVYSELWGWKSKAHQLMWSEMTLSPTKWGNSQRWIDTYSGIEGESPVLEQLYDTGVKQGTPLDPDTMGGTEVYINEAAKMLTVWVTKHLFPWQTPDYYAQEAATLTPSEFNRLHHNQWAKSSEAFIPVEWWDSCKVERFDDLQRRGVIIAIDAATENDCFAIVVVSMSSGGKPQVRDCRIWYPPKGGQIDYAAIEVELLKLFTVYNVVEVAYDPFQMTSMSQRLAGNVFWNAFSQASPRLVADKMLYDTIRDRRIEHDGSFSELRQHIINADRKPEEDKLRIVKRAQKAKIDAVVALSMGVNRAFFYNM